MAFYCCGQIASGYDGFFEETKEDFDRNLQKALGKMGQHFCPAVFNDKIRSDNTVEGMTSFFLDVDVPDNYETQEEAIKTWSEGLKSMGWPEPSLIVNSGSGVHLYWDFKEIENPDDWEDVRNAFVNKSRDLGLKADFQHTKLSSYMRVIGSVNEKNNVIVSIIGGCNKKYKLSDLFINLVEEIAVAQPDIALSEGKGYYKNIADFEQIKTRCKTIEFLADPDNQASVSENDWRAVLSVAKYCKDGDKLIHEVSKYHPDYTPRETEQKADKIKGPYGCDKFKLNCLCNKCANCPHHVKNPLSLGYTKKETETEEEKKLLDKRELITKQGDDTCIGQFIVRKEGIFCPNKSGDDMEQITSVPVYIGDIIENTIGEAVSGCYLKWINSNGEPRNEFIDYATLSSQKECIEWLAKRNLMNKMFKLPQFVVYVYAATSAMERDNLKSGCARYGWAKDDLIMPYGKVTQYGVEDAYIIGNNVSRNIVKPTGEKTELLKELFEYLVKKNNGVLVAPMLMSIAAPLFPKFNQNPIVLYLSGQSGSGKSTVGLASMALYGFNDKFNFISGETTLNSITDKMSSLNCLTLTLDEVSLKRRTDMREIIMQSVNGRPKGRLTKNATQSTKDAWYTPLFVTSNPSYSDGNKEIDNAQGVRMVEFSLWEPLKIPVDFIRRMQAGLVNDGMRIAQYIVKNREYLINIAEKVLNRLTEDDKYDPSMRFLAGSWSVMVAGIEIIKNLYPDIIPLIEPYINRLEDTIVWSKVPVSSVDIITKAVNEWINNNNDVISVWYHKQCINDDKLKRVWARYEKSDNIIFLTRKAISSILEDCAESTTAFNEWCNVKGVKMARVRLMPKSNASECYEYYLGDVDDD